MSIDSKRGDMFGSSSSSDIYFAAEEAPKCAAILLGKAASFYNILLGNSYLDKMRDMWRGYHGAYTNEVGFGHRTNFTGAEGELVQSPVNHFRNLAQHIYVMITSNRPVMEARAVNSDYKSMSQTYIANGILDYYMREKRLEEALKRACEMSIVLGTGYIKLEWNATAGNSYDADPNTGEIDYEGELEFSNLSPLDVVMDGTKETWNNDWLLVRTFQNRFNLMAKYPELANKIKSIVPKSQSSVYRLQVFTNDETDDIPVYEFYHKKTEAMPNGRYLLFLDADVILLDDKMPYRQIPIFRIVPSEIMGTPYGYTPMYDVFPIQEMINATYSAIATNQTAFAVQNIWVPRDSDLVINNLDGALNVIDSKQKPEPLNLLQTSKETFDYLNILIQAAETISGVNSVARGNPEASLKSGTALALVQSMALQFASGLQQSYVKLIEDTGTALINILKDFATTPKFVELVGKNNRPFVKEFTGDTIASINRVIVDVGNPLSRTIAGRVQMAEQLLQMNLVKSPQEYFQVLNTGRIDSLYEGEMSELLLIQSENEMLMEGQQVTAAMLDQHKMHIMEHRSVLADPDLRRDPQLVSIVLNHIQEHITYLKTADPALLGLIGEQSLAPPPQQGPPGGQPPQGGAQNAPPPQHQSPIQKVTAQQQSPPSAGQQIQGPGQQKASNIPQLPKVAGSLLPNAGLQEQALGNVKNK